MEKEKTRGGDEEYGRCLGGSDVNSLVIWEVSEIYWLGGRETGGVHAQNCPCVEGEQNKFSGYRC